MGDLHGSGDGFRGTSAHVDIQLVLCHTVKMAFQIRLSLKEDVT